MILHIGPDEKFIDIAWRSFEAVAPNCNELCVFSDSAKVIFVKFSNAKVRKPQDAHNQSFLDSLRKFDFVVLHCLTETNVQIVMNSSPGVKFLWLGWGCDYYDRFKQGEKALLLPLTLALFKRVQSPYKLFRMKLVLFKQLLMNTRTSFRKCVSRIDFFAPVLPNEYDLCRRNFRSLNAKFVAWNYGNIEDDFSVDGLRLGGEDLLLGNSATYANNHLDAIDCLQKMGKFMPKKIIAPLNYGNSLYQKAIIEEGKKKIGHGFVPLTEFMEQKVYWRTISTCRYVVMNHLRQQAMGNIVMMMNLGASIFLNPQNPAYSFFVDQGAHLFRISELATARELKNFALTNRQIEENKRILQIHWGRKNILQKTENLISEIILYSKSS